MLHKVDSTRDCSAFKMQDSKKFDGGDRCYDERIKLDVMIEAQ